LKPFRVNPTANCVPEPLTAAFFTTMNRETFKKSSSVIAPRLICDEVTQGTALSW